MNVYIFTTILSLLFAAIAGRYNAFNSSSICVNGNEKRGKLSKKSTKYFIFITLTFLTLFTTSALRWNVGLDYNVYIDEFNKIRSVGIFKAFNVSKFESGYVLVNKVISYFSSDYAIMFAVVAFFTLLFFVISVYKYSTVPYVSIFLYIMLFYYYQTFNQIRQMLAVSIVLYSYQYISNRKPIKFTICILIASTFHVSALCFLIAYFVGNWDINKKNISIYFFVGIGSTILLPVTLALASRTRYGVYLDDTFNSLDTKNTIINLLVRIVILVATFCFYSGVIKNNPNSKILYNLCIISVIIQAFTVQFLPFGRLSTYFYIFIIFLIPEVLRSIDNKYLRMISYTVTVCCFIVINYLYFRNSSGYLPYMTLFDR